ncbi:hypothetical protein Ssi03_63440 [Sphaerisporangium siamense]|uniref:HEAT repeat domain-containing protein n=1 Tax=Sphaerisporangium siamense TaxID=795645 RepID=A0A7W7D598_9ACTN|nr:hypothetical protein [Sphaerisporangium siamense]MBB4700483.1 hypothetical protein [Sphaerisporangium siamense]GII88354.1 hypothetical protein Ssi03_63440 [Sphaerisporangium siamense]
MNLVKLEIERHRWDEMQCGCDRSAAHVATDLLRLAQGGERGFDVETLDGHVYISSVLFEPSVPTVSVALAALADDISPDARQGFLEVLLYLVAGEGQSIKAEAEGRDLIDECIHAARSGIWLLYSEMFSGRSVDAAGYAYDVLTQVDDDDDRVRRAQAAAADLLPWDLRPE